MQDVEVVDSVITPGRKRPVHLRRGSTPEEALQAVGLLHGRLLEAEQHSSSLISKVHATHVQSARNLVHYLALRGEDERPLQEALAALGLSSLGRCEAHVLESVERVHEVLEQLTSSSPRSPSQPPFGAGEEVLHEHAAALLGPLPEGRPTRIMVTMPTEAGDSFALVADLVARGMDCARINCAHDDPAAWTRMAGYVRRAAAEAGRHCPIVMDLPGPKLRTGLIETGPQVLKLRPRRDELGRVVEPAAVWLAEPGADVPDGATSVPVTSGWLGTLQVGDRLDLRDARDAHRVWTVAEVGSGAALVDVPDTTYLVPGTVLRGSGDRRAEVGRLPAAEGVLLIRVGDRLDLTADPAPVPRTGRLLEDGSRAFTISCTLPAALGALRPGQRVWFDDGRIGGVVVSTRPGHSEVVVSVAAPSGSKLRAAKGINLPDTDLHLPALGPDDLAALPFVVQLADVVGLSFVQRPADITQLRSALRELDGSGLGLILKIETAKGFNGLQRLLLKAMESERVGVMIARGDLAVECGFERLAEVQEEILWLCEAARVPVVWATQVLDQLARTGQASRAEVTDAAMSERAECVMLNKGPHLPEAVTSLDHITRRMAGHHDKKVSLLRRLNAWTADVG